MFYIGQVLANEPCAICRSMELHCNAWANGFLFMPDPTRCSTYLLKNSSIEGSLTVLCMLISLKPSSPSASSPADAGVARERKNKLCQGEMWGMGGGDEHANAGARCFLCGQHAPTWFQNTVIRISLPVTEPRLWTRGVGGLVAKKPGCMGRPVCVWKAWNAKQRVHQQDADTN